MILLAVPDVELVMNLMYVFVGLKTVNNLILMETVLDALLGLNWMKMVYVGHEIAEYLIQ